MNEVIQIMLTAVVVAVVSYLIYLVKANPKKPIEMDYFEGHAFEGYTEKAFSVPPPYTTNPPEYMLVIFFMVILPLLWVMSNLEAYFAVAVFYAFLWAIIIPVGLFEFKFPKLKATGMLGWGGLEYLEQCLVGLAIATCVLLLNFAGGLSAFQAGEVPAGSYVAIIMTFLFTVVVATQTEEWFFGNFMVCTLIKKTGWFLGILLISFVFAGFHWAAYNANIPQMVVCFGFRVMASVALLKWTSFLPGYTGHFVINLLSWLYNMP